MPKNLTLVECEELGIKFPCERMDNGEFRFRLMDNGENAGWGYILAKMSEGQSGWGNSHYHKGVVETIIVQKGWIGFAELFNKSQVRLRVYKGGELFTAEPGSPHNIYMSSGAVVHAVKHGDCSLEKDWFTCPELDKKIKSLNELDIFRWAGVSPPLQ